MPPKFEEIRDEQMKLGGEVVERAAQTLRDAGYKVTTAVKEGFPKVVIIDHASQWRADLIMLGSHGRKRAGSLPNQKRAPSYRSAATQFPHRRSASLVRRSSLSR